MERWWQQDLFNYLFCSGMLGKTKW